MKRLLLSLTFLTLMPSFAQANSTFFNVCYCEYQGVAGGNTEVRMYGMLPTDGDVKIKKLGVGYSEGRNLADAENFCKIMFKPLVMNNVCPNLE